MRMVGSSQIAAHEPTDKAIIRSTKPGKCIRILPGLGRRGKPQWPNFSAPLTDQTGILQKDLIADENRNKAGGCCRW